MTAASTPAGRFVLAPVVNGAAAWDQATPLVIAPFRLAPVSLVVPFRNGRSAGLQP